MHSTSNHGWGFVGACGIQLLIGHPLHIQMKVNAIHQWAANPLLVALNHAHRAGTLVAVIAVPAARAWFPTVYS